MRVRMLLAVGLLGCAPQTKEIDDPQLTASAVQLGAQTSEMSAMDAAADDSEVQGKVQSVGGSLQSIVSQHQATASGTGALSRASRGSQARATTADEPISWDGSELCVDIDLSSGGTSIQYHTVLDITQTPDGNTIDGEYHLAYVVGTVGVGVDYSVDAIYNQLKTNAAGCAVSGSVEISYDYTTSTSIGIPGANVGSQSGMVVVTYNGCDDVTVSGT